MTHNTFSLPGQHASTQSSPVLLNTLLFWGEPLVVLLFALSITLPGLLWPVQWQAAAVIVLYLLLWLQRILHRRFNRALRPTQQATSLLLLWVPVAVAIMTDAALGWQAAGYLLLGIALYQVIVAHEWFKSEPANLWWVLLSIGALLTLVAPSTVNWKSEFRLFYVPLYDLFAVITVNSGETIHANLLAGALVLVGMLLIPQLLPKPQVVHKIHLVDAVEGSKTLRIRHPSHTRQRLITMLLTLLLLAMLGILFLTQSRGGYLAFCVGVAIVFLLRWPRLWLAVPFLLGGFGYGIYTFGAEGVFDLLGADNTFGGAEWRGPVWHASWQALQDFAWTGIGIGNFQQVMPRLYPNPAITNTAATHAHNLLLQIGLDLGLPGLAAYVTFYLTMIGMTLAVLRRTRSPQTTATALGATWDGHTLSAPPEVGITVSTKRFIRQLVHQERTRQQHWALAAGCLAALTGMQIHGLLDAVTWGNKLAFIPWLIFAQITLLYRYHTAPQNTPEA